MTPIFVRPVREQLEHDRLIRFLTARYKRKFDVLANVGDQQVGAVKLGTNVYYPDMVLVSAKKLAGLVEVETLESTNNLEAMAQWTHFSRARVPFHLYVPVLAYDAARRLCEANQVSVSEIWTYRAVNDQFDLVRMFADANALKAGNKVAVKASLFVPEPPPKVEPPPPPPPPKIETPVKPVGKVPVKSITVMSKGTGKPAPPVKPVPVAKPVVAAKPVKPVKAAKAVPAKASKPAKPAPKAAKAKPSRKPAPKAAAKRPNKKRK